MKQVICQYCPAIVTRTRKKKAVCPECQHKRARKGEKSNMIKIDKHTLDSLKRSDYFDVFAELSNDAQYKILDVCRKLKNSMNANVQLSYAGALDVVCKITMVNHRIDKKGK